MIDAKTWDRWHSLTLSPADRAILDQMEEEMAFTLAFEGDIRKFNFNALRTETVFGVAETAGIGNEFEKTEIMREALELISHRDRNGKIGRIAQAALDEIDGLAIAELKQSAVT